MAITELTPEQEQKLEANYQQWLKLGLSTDRLDRNAVSQAIFDLYEVSGYKQPEILFFESPKACLRAWEEHEGRLNEGHTQTSSMLGGVLWCGWEFLYDFAREIKQLTLDEKDNKLLDIWLAQARACHIWFAYQEVALISERPIEIHIDDRGRLNNTTGPALAYSDGSKLYSVGGVRIDGKVIEDPNYLSYAIISAETNQEVKRVLMQLFGWEKYIAQSGMHFIQKDDFGELYGIDDGPIPIRVVKVRNSSAEPDGSFKYYYLKGRTDAKTAKECVASTFGVSAEQYNPAIET